MEERKTYSDFGLNKKQGDYVMYLMMNYPKRKAYSKAYGMEDLDNCDVQVWKLEQRIGDKLNAYMKYLASIKEEEFVTNLRQLRELWMEIAFNEDNYMKDRLKASELLGKSINAFTENYNIEAKVEQVVFTNEDDINE